MAYNIYFVKTAKCATETIREYLIQYAKKNKLIINDRTYESFYQKSVFNINTNHIWNNEKSHKHFQKSKSEYLPTIHLTAIREPLKRLYSHYCYGHPYFNKGVEFNEWYMKVHTGDLRDFWPVSKWGDRTNNYISHYMNVSSVEEFEEFYDFTFVKEHFDKSLDKFEGVIDFEFNRLPNQLNINNKVDRDYKFSDEVVELFNQKNQLDIEIYNKSVELLNKI